MKEINSLEDVFNVVETLYSTAGEPAYEIRDLQAIAKIIWMTVPEQVKPFVLKEIENYLKQQEQP